MALVGDWEQVERGLPAGWADARVLVTLEEPGEIDRVTRAARARCSRSAGGRRRVSIRIARSGGGPSPEALRRALARLDARAAPRRALARRGRVGAASRAERAPAPDAAESWDAALADVPADWSDLLGEIELDSSDYLDRGRRPARPAQPAPRRRGRCDCSSGARAASATAPRRGWCAAASSAATPPGSTGGSRSCACLSDTPAGGDAGARLADRRPHGLSAAEIGCWRCAAAGTARHRVFRLRSFLVAALAHVSGAEAEKLPAIGVALERPSGWVESAPTAALAAEHVVGVYHVPDRDRRLPRQPERDRGAGPAARHPPRVAARQPEREVPAARDPEVVQVHTAPRGSPTPPRSSSRSAAPPS